MISCCVNTDWLCLVNASAYALLYMATFFIEITGSVVRRYYNGIGLFLLSYYSYVVVFHTLRNLFNFCQQSLYFHLSGGLCY